MCLPALHSVLSRTRGTARLGLRQVGEIKSKHRVWSILEFSPLGTQRRIEPVPPSSVEAMGYSCTVCPHHTSVAEQCEPDALLASQLLPEPI